MLASVVILLLVLLLVPMLCKQLRLPGIVGLIIAGMAIGKYGFNLVDDSAVIGSLGKMGMIYLMFLSGVEIDILEFKRNRHYTAAYGIYTFLVPFVLGYLTTRFVLHFSPISSLLLASMYGSHTLMTYPTVSRYGLQRQDVVSVAVGGTMIAITLSLLVLAVIKNMHVGEFTAVWAAKTAAMIAVFLIIVLGIFPKLASWSIKRWNNTNLEFLLVLSLVAIASWLADIAGLEAILGAFLAGVALNKRIPNLSPLMGRLNFVGNTLFIPLFLVSVGMMIDIRTFLSGWSVIGIMAVMLLTKLSGKWLAAWLGQLTFGYSATERRLLYGLSSASAAGTLAVITIGCEAGIVPMDVMNATVGLILFSCIIASLLTEYASKQIALENSRMPSMASAPARVLIPISNSYTDTALIDLSLLITPEQTKAELYALAVSMTENDPTTARLLTHATEHAMAASRSLNTISQVAANTANGVIDVANEKQITHLVMGIGWQADGKSFTRVMQQIHKSSAQTLLLYRQKQPLNTIEHIRVAVPLYAEKEEGFIDWYVRLRSLCQQTGAKVTFYTNKQTAQLIRQLSMAAPTRLSCAFKQMQDWEDVLMIAKDIKPNEMLTMVLARRGTVSYNPLFEEVPANLMAFFNQVNILLIIPSGQSEDALKGVLHDMSDTAAKQHRSIMVKLKQLLLRRMRNRQYTIPTQNELP